MYFPQLSTPRQSRVTVSRVLSEFARRGFLETGYRSMRILDRGALIDFASQRED